MKQYSFNLPKKLIEDFKSKVPERHRARMIRKVLNEKDLLLERVELEDSPTVVHPFWLYDNTVELLDDHVQAFQLKDPKANRSTVMRSVLSYITDTYEDNPINPDDYIFRTFQVKKGTKELLASFIPGNEKNEIVEAFVLDEYIPSRELSFFQSSPSEIEVITFTLHKDAYQRLDNYKEDLKYGVSGISRAGLMRDVLHSLIEQFQGNEIDSVKEQFKSAYFEYKSKAPSSEVRESLLTYLNELDKKHP